MTIILWNAYNWIMFTQKYTHQTKKKEYENISNHMSLAVVADCLAILWIYDTSGSFRFFISHFFFTPRNCLFSGFWFYWDSFFLRKKKQKE